MTVRRSLDRRRLNRAFVGIALASAAAIIWGGATGRATVVTAAAGCFALSATVIGALCNPEVWHLPRLADADTTTHVAVWRNVSLSITAYCWGAIVMQGLYLTPLTGLKWQHGWQYALAMALLGAGWLALGRKLRRGSSSIFPSHSTASGRLVFALALGQGLIAAGGLAALIISGKLWSVRADWAANRVFAALAIAVLGISLFTCLSQAAGRADPTSR